ncbi:MAG: thermonuclease family protein [Haliea sp.]
MAARSRKNLTRVAVILLGLTLFQYFSGGEITWHRQLLTTVTGGDGPEPGWRHATDKLEQAGAAREGTPLPDFDISGRVVRVADGDTVSLLDSNNEQHRIRLYGIDAPEHGQPHGDRAREALAGMVAGRHLGVVVVETDDYGRLVGTLYADSRNINLALVQQGHAWWYQYFARHERPLEAAEVEARSARRGLWAGHDPIPPWDWRRQQRLGN